MIRISVLAIGLIVAVAPTAIAHPKSSVKGASPTTITACGTISSPGDYVLANNLVLTVNNPSYGEGGDCLDITASGVNINMQGWSITVSCPDSCLPEEYGPVGSDGIHIMSGANNVSISNGEVDDFLYGLVAEGNNATVSSFTSFNAVVGVSLDGASNGAFSNISFNTGDLPYHFSVGPIVSVTGGGHNSFTTVSGTVGGGFGSPQAIVISDSSHNSIVGADVSCEAEEQVGPGILLTANSGHNSITKSTVYVLYGNGIEVDLGSNYNDILENTVSILSPEGFYAMVDENPRCGHDAWVDNSFTNANPTSCID
jgi:hypothetical protein